MDVRSALLLSAAKSSLCTLYRPVQALHVPEMKPVAPPSDAANLIAFLSSDMVSQINGAVIPIDNAFSVT